MWQRCLKADCYAYSNVFKWESRQFSGLNDEENTDNNKKMLETKVAQNLISYK